MPAPTMSERILVRSKRDKTSFEKRPLLTAHCLKLSLLFLSSSSSRAISLLNEKNNPKLANYFRTAPNLLSIVVWFMAYCPIPNPITT